MHEHEHHSHEHCSPEHGCACCAHSEHNHARHSHEQHTPEHGCACCAHEGHDHAHSAGSDKLLIGRLLAGAVLFAAGMFLNGWPELAVMTAAYIILGCDVLFYATKNLFRGFVFDENFLMAIATVGAIVIQKMPEAAAVMLFYQIGEFLTSLAVSRSKKSVADLMDIRPDSANLVTPAGIRKVAPETVSVGNVIAVSAGEKIPLDGEIIEGESYLDTAALTGESVPRKASPGDSVLSGSINTAGLLKIRVTKSYQDSSVSKIMELLENAQQRKSGSERFITVFAKRYTPIVVLLAALIAVFPPLFTGFDFAPWVYRAMIFLVVSCPCALVVSVPLGFFAGIGGASKKGILMKGSNAIEALSKVKTIAFDKTGTITKGQFTLTEIRCNGEKPIFLDLLVHAEFYSTHPIGRAIVSAAQSPIDESRISNYTEIAGKGISVQVSGKSILAGNGKLMRDNGVTPPDVPEASSIVYMAVDGQYAGYAVVSDIIRENSADSIRRLKAAGLKTVMVSGDVQSIACRVGKEVGVDEVYAELLPQDKVAQIEKLQQTSKTAFAGDGINDAPVLAYADVGIAMGGVGSDSAIEAADMVIMTDDLAKIPLAIRISKHTMRIVWQNIIFAIGVKVLVLILGALGLSTMWMAIFADVGVTLIAVLNSIRAMVVHQ